MCYWPPPLLAASFLESIYSNSQIDRDDVPLRPLSTSIHPDGLADVTGRFYQEDMRYQIYSRYMDR
jgi:hypothetical protein